MTAPSPPVVAVVLAGGAGTRFGAVRPKQLALLAGSPVLHHVLRRFDIDRIDRIVVAANTEWEAEIRAIADDAVRGRDVTVVAGSGDRNSSLLNGLEGAQVEGDAKVLVHDSVRPLVTRSLICRVIDALEPGVGCLPVIPSADALPVVRKGQVLDFADRRTVMRGQSPQGFMATDLVEAFSTCPREDLGRLSTAYEVLLQQLDGYRIEAVEGEHQNLKITLPVDHMIAGRLLLEEW